MSINVCYKIKFWRKKAAKQNPHLYTDIRPEENGNGVGGKKTPKMCLIQQRTLTNWKQAEEQ